jgi:predicted Zn-dependent protease
MHELSHPDTFHLQAAQGWLELGDISSANEELGRISGEAQQNPVVLMVRWHVHEKAKDWPSCVEVGQVLVGITPQVPVAWVNFCNALFFAGRTQEAYDTLLPVMPRFPDNAVMPYNLACYACQLGRLDEARELLVKAFDMEGGKRLKARALEDPDLQPLWDELRNGRNS